jgi:hypothetical protein
MRTKPAEVTKGFFYRDADHKYFLNGKQMTGNTTVSKTPSYGNNLQVWYAKETAEAVWKNRKLCTTEEGLKSVLMEAINSPSDQFEGAAGIGTKAHKICELFDLGLPYDHMPKESIALAQNYMRWQEKNVEEVLFCEKPVFSEEHFVAGTPDGGFVMKNGKKLINDKKFKNGIYALDPFMQMAGYRMMMEEMAESKTPVTIWWSDGRKEEYATAREYLGTLGGVKWDGAVVLMQRKPLADQTDKLFPKTQWDCGLEEIYRYDFETDKKAFLAGLELYRANQTFKPTKHK